ncbi:unnamed protein product, partial [Polarella glacialis]
MTHEAKSTARSRRVDAVAALYVKRPWPACCGCLSVMLLMGGVSYGLGYVTIKNSPGAWSILDGEMTQHYVAFKDATSKADGTKDSDASSTITKERMMFYYKTNTDAAFVAEASGMIFTKERLADMCRLERGMVNNSKANVTMIDSVIGLFYGDGSSVPKKRTLKNYDWSCQELGSSSVDSTVAAMRSDLQSLGPKSPYSQFVDWNFREMGVSAYTRSMWMVEIDESNVDTAMVPVLEKLGLSYGFLRSAYQGDADRFVASGNLRVRLLYTGTDEFGTMVGPDLILSAVSMGLVFLIMWAHTRSSFLAACGMGMMLLSMPIAAIFYQGVFGVTYFEFLHVLVVYLVLGIGADDIFVFVDTFKHIMQNEGNINPADGRLDEETLTKILSLTFQRSGMAIFNTSFTTAVAFLSCSGSKAMPMRTCGWYAAACIMGLYVLTMTFVPSCVVIWHTRLEGKRCCCPGWSLRPIAVQYEAGAERNLPRPGMVERFLQNVYLPLMTKKVVGVKIYALFMVVIMASVAIQGIFFTTRLTPPTKEEVWFPDNHMLLEISEFVSSNYFAPPYANYATIEMFFGVSHLDRSGVDIYNPGKFSGTAVFDDAFDLSTSEAQASMLETCKLFDKLKCDLKACDNQGYDTLRMQTADRTGACFLEDFQTWSNGTLPTGAAFEPQLKIFRQQADKTSYYEDILKQEVDYKTDIGFINDKLKYVIIKIRSCMAKSQPFSRGVQVRDLMRRFVEERKAASPASLQSVKFIGMGHFANYDLGEELLSGLFSGCAIAAPISFLVVLCSTYNLIVSVYAVASVAAIVFCVLGFCKSAMDWDLGVGEAIAGVIVIGYSVDYVVHLAHMYCEAKEHGHKTRDARARFAILNIGSTVFAGALTTASAGAVMFFCFFYFFFKMALLICITIFYAFLFSLGFFMAIMFTVGPENDFGELRIPGFLRKYLGLSDKEAPGVVSKIQ